MLVKPAFRLAVIMLVLLFAASAWAATTGKIAGKVTDKETGEPLPGVNVIIVGTTTGAATNIQGEFFIINVPPGNYTLRATLIGYRPVEVKNAQVSVDLTTNIDVALSSQAVEMGTITVEATRPLIEKDLTSSRTTIAPSQITDSANDGIVNRANLTAGAVQGSFRGGRINQGEVIFMLDGVNLSNPLGETRVGRDPGSGSNTALATYIPNEGIAEAEVLTGGFGAEYPDVQSAIVNMVAKQGGEKYTGKLKTKSAPEVFANYHNDFTDVFRVPIMTGSLPDTHTVTQVFERTAQKVDDKNRSQYWDMRQHEFSIGGPVPISSMDVPGRLSFFASGIYAYNRGYVDQRNWLRTQSMLGKLTYELSASKKLYVTGLKSFGNGLPWDRNRILRLTWGQPTYYHRTDVSTTTNQSVQIDTFYTPYSWIMAPGYIEDKADSAYFAFVARLTGNASWADSGLGAYPSVPDNVKYLAVDSVESLGWAKAYTKYDMGNSVARAETWSNEFSLSFVNNISAKSYYSLMYSRFLTAQRARTYDPWDGHPLSSDEMGDLRFVPRVTSIQSAQLWANPMYISRFRQDDRTTIHTMKGDFTSQINSYNFVKFGAEVKWFDLLYDYRSKASGNNEYNSQYHEKPLQMGAYAQDKIETQGMIVNVGLRYDYFDPRTLVPFNFSDPLNAPYMDPSDPLYNQTGDLANRLKDPVPARSKQQLSPRVGISYPITDKDVLHVTYGQYFQLPVFDDFYTNHAFDLRGAFKYIGNPNLKEEKTVSYEAGIDHGFNDFLKLAVTGFYKDIAGLIDHQRYFNPQTGNVFWIYGNSDFARVKGFEITFSQRPWHNLSGIITYTYQIARGRSSDKTQSFLDNYFNRKPRTEDFPLDWDVRHTLKGDVNWRTPVTMGPVLGDFGIDVVGTYGSGVPYTGVSRVIAPNLPPINNNRFPAAWSIDLRVDKGVNVYKSLDVDVFVEVRNITNRANVNLTTANSDNFNVERFEATGDPTGQFNDPSFWTAPRRILLGAQLSF